MSEDLVKDFLNEQTSQDAQNSMDNASSHERLTLSVSGKYRMAVDTFGYVKDNEPKMFPCFDRSSQKGVLQLVIPLRVVDGTPEAPKGSLMFFNINIAPAPGAKKETLQTMARMAKPKLVAMLGHDQIKMDAGWLVANLTPAFDRNGDEMTMSRDHKLKQEVMVTVEDDFYNNKPKLKVTTIVAASDIDCSISNKPVTEVKASGKDPADLDYSKATGEGDVADAEKMANDAIKDAENADKSGETNLQSKTEDF